MLSRWRLEEYIVAPDEAPSVMCGVSFKCYTDVNLEKAIGVLRMPQEQARNRDLMTEALESLEKTYGSIISATPKKNRHGDPQGVFIVLIRHL